MKKTTKKQTLKRTKAQSKAAPLLLHSATQLVTMRGGAGARRGAELRDIGVIADGAVLVSGGKIVAVGSTDALRADDWIKKHRKDIEEIDCSGQVVVPGFVDSHTHPVFAAPRLVDFEKRTAGASYEESAEAGGGIRSSLDGVRRATESGLAEMVLAAFESMIEHGTTTIEAKSGYGLSLESEIKSLKSIRAAAECFPGTVISTLLGAHVVPPELRQNPEEYVRVVCTEMIPKVVKAGLAEYVDVFCERGAFTVEQSDKILGVAVEHGLKARAHVCQLSECELGPLMRHGLVSVDHVDHIRDSDLYALAKSATIATLVPGANYFLGKPYPPARKLIDAGVAVALATDYNPGSSPTLSMPMVMSLACTQMKMTPAEALTAATINGAHALGLHERKGSIEPGKDADMAVFEADDYREIAYWFGENRCSGVVVSGQKID